jgi:hypothetical protein
MLRRSDLCSQDAAENMRVAKSVDLMDERFCLSSSVLFMHSLVPSSEKPEAKLSVSDVAEGRRLCPWPVIRRFPSLLSESLFLWMAGVIVSAFRNLCPQMRLRARLGDVEAQLRTAKKGQDFASLTSRVERMAAASCARSLLIYLAFDGCGLPNLGSVAKVMVRHSAPHCGPADFTPKALTWSGSDEHGRPHVVTKFCR